MTAVTPTFVSGPISVHVFDAPTSDGRHGASFHNRIYIFGDQHFSYAHRCRPCLPSHGCERIVDFIERLVQERQVGNVGNQPKLGAPPDALLPAGGGVPPPDRSLDVYMEMPYIVPRGRWRSKVLREKDPFMRRDGPPPRTETAARPRADYIGMLSQLYQRFYSRMYDDPTPAQQRSLSARPRVRFHYCDARMEPNVSTLLPYEPGDHFYGSRLNQFHLHMDAPAKLLALLEALLFSTDFVAEVRRLFGEDAPPLVTETLSGKGVYRVAKQYHRLQEGPAKRAVRSYLSARAAEVVQNLRAAGMFDYAAALRALRAFGSGSLPHAPRLDERQVRDYLGRFILEMFFARVLVMDAYLVCRMVRFSLQRGDSARGTSVVYVGDSHAAFYVRFFTEFMGLRALTCQNRVAVDGTSSNRRCVRLDRACRRRAAPGGAGGALLGLL
jgi:hypothetical protein